MRIAYRTNGLPRIGSGAFLPTYAQTPQGVSAGDLRTTGMQGTRPVMSPRPAAMQDAWFNNQPSEAMDVIQDASPWSAGRPIEMSWSGAGVPGYGGKRMATPTVPPPGPFINLTPGIDPGYATGAFLPPKARINPDAIWPDGYVSHVDGCAPPMAIYSDNVGAVPAGDVSRFADTLMRAVRMGGLRVTRNPRPFPRWPTYGNVIGAGLSNPKS